MVTTQVNRLKAEGCQGACLVPMLLRGNPYGIRSHAGVWEREKIPHIHSTSVRNIVNELNSQHNQIISGELLQ